MTGEWSADLTAPGDCTDASCAFCQVKAAGARAIAAAVGEKYDEFDTPRGPDRGWDEPPALRGTFASRLR